MDELRTRRVAETMREELSELIRFELADPRVSHVEVADVHVTHDLKRADIVVVVPDAAALEGLEHSRYYLRRKLMERMDLYRMPELRFVSSLVGSTASDVRKLQRRMRRGRGQSTGTA